MFHLLQETSSCGHKILQILKVNSYGKQIFANKENTIYILNFILAAMQLLSFNT